MALTEAVTHTVAQAALLLGVSPLLQGLIKKAKARLQNRQGPPLLQPYRDLAKLFRKEAVVPEPASWLFAAAPYLAFGSVLAAGLTVPLAPGLSPPLGRVGGVIVLTFLYALARFVAALAALDGGSAFGGMGASRELAISALVEPALLMSLFTVALAAGSTDLEAMRRTVAEGGLLLAPHFLALAGFLVVLVAETGRIPVDNPDTHLELTMMHEGMILEHSGRHLALAQWAHMVKQLTLCGLVAAIFLPWAAGAGPAAWAALAAKLALLAVALAVVETAFAKLRLFRVPDLLGASFLFSFLALVWGQWAR